MRLPHFNRLTGIRWWRQLPELDISWNQWLATGSFIRESLGSSKPFAMGKVGTTELMGLEYLYRWIQLPWPPAASWRRPARRLHDCSGLFPVRKEIYLRWAEEYRRALAQMDLLAQWQPVASYLAVVEDQVLAQLAPGALRAHRNFVYPLEPPASWLGDIARLRWLVVHPFEKTIRDQLANLPSLGVYPEESGDDLRNRARDTRILPCPQFAYMVPPKHPDWFGTLAELQDRMEEIDFELALIGAGAWSLPLAVHAKNMGRKAIHLGGSLQLLFGIKGTRFDSARIYNSHWVRPRPEERPANCHLMEKGAYW
jgi:hypothetical protein